MPNHPTLASLAADLDSGRTGARKLVEECLAKIADEAGEGGRAFIHVDKEAALEAADAMDRLRKVHAARSEEHTSELQSQSNLVCRLLLEKKKKKNTNLVNLKKKIKRRK